MGYGLDNQDSVPRRTGIFLFATTSTPVLGSTQRPIQWIAGAVSLGEKWLELEAGHSPPQYFSMAWCLGIRPVLPF